MTTKISSPDATPRPRHTGHTVVSQSPCRALLQAGCGRGGSRPRRRSVQLYATEWIDAHSGGYRAPIKRLRWKDHRNMAVRGDDVIGIFQDAQTQRLHFLKTEANSRITLTAQVLTEALAGLDKDAGLPSAHALACKNSFMAVIAEADTDCLLVAVVLEDSQLTCGATICYLSLIAANSSAGSLLCCG